MYALAGGVLGYIERLPYAGAGGVLGKLSVYLMPGPVECSGILSVGVARGHLLLRRGRRRPGLVLGLRVRRRVVVVRERARVRDGLGLRHRGLLGRRRRGAGRKRGVHVPNGWLYAPPSKADRG